MQDGNVYVVTAPSNFRYVGIDTDGGVVVSDRISNATVSCNCVGTGSCKPFSGSSPGGGQAVGCTGICSDCRMKSSVASKVMQSGSGFVNFDYGVSFVENDESLPVIFPAMLEVPELRDRLKSFLDEIYQGKAQPEVEIIDGHITAPDGYVIAAINAFGRITVAVVPNNPATMKYYGGSGSCSCSDGECKLKKMGGFGYVVYSCEGLCKGTCTLKVKSSSITVYSSETYAY